MTHSGLPPRLLLLPSSERQVSSKLPMFFNCSSGIDTFELIGSRTAVPNSTRSFSQLSNHINIFLYFVHLTLLSYALCPFVFLKSIAITSSTIFNNSLYDGTPNLLLLLSSPVRRSLCARAVPPSSELTLTYCRSFDLCMLSLKGKLTKKRYRCATVFVDHYSRLRYVHLQVDDSSIETVATKRMIERGGGERWCTG